MTNDETKSFDDEASEVPVNSDAVESDISEDLPGEELAAQRADDQTPEYEVVDDEAEELVTPEDEPAVAPANESGELHIDDQEQLSEAEAVAAKAPSTRPVRKKKQPAAASAELAEPAEQPVTPVSNRPVRKAPASAEVVEKGRTPKKGHATAARSTTAVRKRRTTPGVFVEQSVGELRKVVWPTGEQLRLYFIVVLIFVLFIIAYVGLLDVAFGWVLLKFLG